MRGLAVSWCYDRVEEGLTALENPSQAMVFAAGSRVVGRERLDPRAVTLSQGPTAVLHVGGVKLYNAQGYGGPEVIYRSGKGNIVFNPDPPGGTQNVDIEITPRYSGPNKFVLEIIGSGVIGNRSIPGRYKLRRTPWTGSEWGTEVTVSEGSIPLDGVIDVGDGTVFKFLAKPSSVVGGDTYSWETDSDIVINHPNPPGGTEDVGVEKIAPCHSGNNSYVLTITASGTVGIDGAYDLSRTPWTGSAWGTTESVSFGSIPTDGRIDVGNGTTFVFALNEPVVADDTYSWETEAYRVTNQEIRDATVTINAYIYAQTEEEAIGSGGYLDQLMLMFHKKNLAAELYDSHYETVTEEMRDMNVTPEIDGEQTVYRITISLLYTGKVFMAEVSPLITRMEYDEPDIP